MEGDWKRIVLVVLALTDNVQVPKGFRDRALLISANGQWLVEQEPPK